MSSKAGWRMRLYDVAVSADGLWCATCGNGGGVAVLHTATGMHVRRIQCQPKSTSFNGVHVLNIVDGIVWSPDGSLLATASERDGTARVLAVATGAVVHVLEGLGGSVTSVAWNPAGDKLCAGSREDAARVWDVATGAVVRDLNSGGSGGHVLSVAWSPEGEVVAAGALDGDVTLWQAATGTVLHVLHGQEQPVLSVAWSPDGRTVASGAGDRTARVWDATTGTMTHTLQNHRMGLVRSVAWSPDGRFLATGSMDRTVRLWDLATAPQQPILAREINLPDPNVMVVASVVWRGGHVFVTTCSGALHIFSAREGH